MASLLRENPLDDPDYEYTGPLSLAPFRQRKSLDIDETSDDGLELAIPGLLRGPLNAAVRMGQMARGKRAPGLLLGDVMDFSPAGLLGRMPTGALGMNVFHGTPNFFKPEPGFPQGRPRLDKMGTGEGAQAYGPGFYSAESRGVGSDYRDKLAPPPGVRVSGKPITPFQFADDLKDKVAIRYPEMPVEEVYRQSANAARMIFGRAEEIKKLDGADNVMMRAFLDRQSKNDDDLSKVFRVARDEMPAATWSEKTGFLYKLDIPDADAAKLLDYDAPISAQPKEILQKIEPMIRAAKGYDPNTATQSNLSKIISANGNLRPEVTGEMFFKGLAQDLGGDEAAADALRKIGIPGLKYLDQGSRDSGEGTRNFVVWDQDVLDRTKILQRNDETFEAAPGVPAMGLLNSDNDNRPGGTNLLGLYTGGVI